MLFGSIILGLLSMLTIILRDSDNTRPVRCKTAMNKSSAAVNTATQKLTRHYNSKPIFTNIFGVNSLIVV